MRIGEHDVENPLRVTFITQWYAPELGDGGIPRGIATALRNEGAEINVLTGLPNYPEGRLYPGYRVRPYQREEIDGLSVHRAPLYFSHDTDGRRRAANYLSFAASSTAVGLGRVPRADVTLVYSSPITSAVPAMALRRLRRTPYVLLVQDMWPQSVTASGFLPEATVRRLQPRLQQFCDHVYRRAAQVAVTSPGMVELIAERGVPRDRLHFVANWADEDAYRPVSFDKQVRQQLGLTRPFNLMYAGNLGEMQNLDLIVDAATMLRNNSDIGFHFIGRGAVEDRLRRMISDRGLNNVGISPPQPANRMAHVLAAAQVQIVSLRDEAIFRHTMPSKVQSLLATGRPILGVVEGDAAQVIRASGAGILARTAADVAAAARSLSVLEPAELERMGHAGRAYYAANFSKARSVAKLLQVLNKARGK